MTDDYQKIIDKINAESDRKLEIENMETPKKLIVTIITFFISCALWAVIVGIVILIVFGIKKLSAEPLNDIQSHRPIYIIAGDKENQVKYEVSFKYALWYPFETGLFLSYTQLAKWNVYDRSSPFKEVNYSPSIFWEIENINNYLNFIRIIPYEHKSNGKAGLDNRSTDRYFIETEAGIGNYARFGIREKAGGFYSVANKNKDIKRYIGFFETELFLQLFSRQGFIGHERIYVKGEWTHRFYWLEAGLSFRIFTSMLQPDFYIQYFRGYGEFLIDYNKKTESFRAGFIFNN